MPIVLSHNMFQIWYVKLINDSGSFMILNSKLQCWNSQTLGIKMGIPKILQNKEDAHLCNSLHPIKLRHCKKENER